MQLHVVGIVAVPLFDSTTHGLTVCSWRIIGRDVTAETMMYQEPVRFFPWHLDEISSCVGL
jgi:hypothetical protein